MILASLAETDARRNAVQIAIDATLRALILTVFQCAGDFGKLVNDPEI